MRITKLPHWVMTDKFPAFYDSESATAIEQTAKIYGAMQELIEDYNKWVDETNTIIEDFINSTNQNIEVFTTQMEQKFNDFVKVIELKITEQDQRIDESIVYIKNNLAQYIIDNVENTMKELISAGEVNEELESAFDEIIEKYNNVTLETVNTYKEDVNKALADHISEVNRAMEEFKAEVNSQVSNVSAKGFYPIKMPLGLLTTGSEVQYTNEITNSECLTSIKGFIERVKTDGIKKPCLIIENTIDSTELNGETIENPSPRELRLSNMSESLLDNGITSYTLYGSFDIDLPTLSNEIETGVTKYDGYSDDKYVTLNVQGTWNEDVFTVSGLSISLLKSTVVSKQYVDSIAVGGDVDLSDYATTEYVDNAIQEIEIPEPNLDDYATTLYVDNAIAEVPIPSLDGYATEDYVDEALTGVGGSDIPEIPYEYTFELVNNATLYLGSLTDSLTNLLTEYKDKILDSFYVVSNSNTAYTTNIEYKFLFRLVVNTSKKISKMSELTGTNRYEALIFNESKHCYDRIYFTFTSSYSGDVFNGSINSQFTINRGYIITKSNTSSYTPTGDYNPATKQYVDLHRPQIFSRKLTNATNTISADTQTKVVFDSTVADINTGKITTNSNGEGFLIKTFNTTHVKVSAYLNFNPGTEGQTVTTRILKNDTVVGQFGVSCSDQNGNLALTISNFPIPVTANDVIYITVASGNEFSVRANSYITIEGMYIK